jgi:hypothetical protein
MDRPRVMTMALGQFLYHCSPTGSLYVRRDRDRSSIVALYHKIEHKALQTKSMSPCFLPQSLSAPLCHGVTLGGYAPGIEVGDSLTYF